MRISIILLIFCLSAHYMNGKESEDIIIVRENYLKNIDDHFKSTNIVIIQGLPGMGKTKLAQSYLNRRGKDYKKTFWVNWDAVSFNEQLLHFTKNIKPISLKERKADGLSDEIVQRLKYYSGKILLIIDNLNDVCAIQEILNPLNGNKNVDILITTCSNKSMYSSVRVGVFKIHESVMALKCIAPTIDSQSAKIISKNLANYPYFVIKVGKMISKSPTVNVKRIINLILNHPDDVPVAFFKREEDFENMENSMKTRGEIAIQDKIICLKNENPKSFSLLVFLAHLGTKSIPIDLIHTYYDDENEADKSIKFLIDNDFITNTDKQDEYITFGIHQITQSIIKSVLTEKEKDDSFQKVPQAFIKFYHKNFAKLVDLDIEDQIYYSHLSKIQQYIKDDHLLVLLRILYLKRALYSQRDPEEASRYFVKIEYYLQKNDIEDKKLLADYLADSIYMKGFSQAGNPKKSNEGISDGHKAIKAYERLYNNEGICKCYTRMAWISLYQGNTDECLLYLKKANEILSSVKENYILKENLFTTSWYNIEIGEYQKAIDYSLKGIKIDNVAKNIYLGIYFRVHLAHSYMHYGKINEALLIIDEGLDRESELFKKGGTLVKAELLAVKALCMICLDRLRDAKNMINESLQIYEKILENTPYQDKAIALKILGDIEIRMTSYNEATDILLKARNMFEQLNPHNKSLKVAECLRLLSFAWVKLGDRDKFEEAYQSLKDNFGSDHTETQKLQKDILELGYRFIL